MLSFIDEDEDLRLRHFIANDLSLKFNMCFTIDEETFVEGLYGDDRIVDAFIIRFFPEESTVEWCEDRVAYEVNRFLQEENMGQVHRLPIILRDVWLDRIRYGLVYVGD